MMLCKSRKEIVKPVLKICGLLIQVNYSENCTFGTLKGQSLNKGGL